MKKITISDRRNKLGIIAFSLILGFISVGQASAIDSTNGESNSIQTVAIQDTNQTTANKDGAEAKEKQEKVHVILNGDTVVSYAAIDSTTTDISEENQHKASSPIYTSSRSNNRVDNETLDKVGMVTENIENIISALGDSTFGSIMGVMVGLLVATLAIVFVLFVLGFPIWVILFFIWLYRRIRRNREEQRMKNEASFTYRKRAPQEPVSDLGKDANSNAYDSPSQNLDDALGDYDFREAILSANDMIEASIRQIFVGLGVGFFLAVFISFPMGVAIGGLILVIAIGKNMSGKQRLKNIKEYRAEKENYYRQQAHKQTNSQHEHKKSQHQGSSENNTSGEPDIDSDNRQQL